MDLVGYMSVWAVANGHPWFKNLVRNLSLVLLKRLLAWIIWREIVGRGCFDLSRRMWHSFRTLWGRSPNFVSWCCTHLQVRLLQRMHSNCLTSKCPLWDAKEYGGCMEKSMSAPVELQVCQLINERSDSKGKQYLIEAVQLYMNRVKIQGLKQSLDS